MGNAEGARKAKMYAVEQYGSIERYREKMRELASKGGKNGSNGVAKMTTEQLKVYSARGVAARRKKKLVQ